MMRLPRIAVPFTLSCCLVCLCAPAIFADDATPAVPAAADQSALVDQVDTFWHYGKIARYDLAADAGNQILAAAPDPTSLLQAFETVAQRKGDDIDTWMLRWRTLHPPTEDQAKDDPLLTAQRDGMLAMKATAQKLMDQINLGYEARRANPDFIMNTIVAMSQGERAYENNLPRLANSGELAVKVLVDILRNPEDRELNPTARRALRDLGRKALGPLLAATEMTDYDTLLDVVTALGDIGYEPAAPYLSRLATSRDVPQGIRIAAHNALIHMGVSDSVAVVPAEQFYELAEKLYYGTSSIAPSGDKTAYVWFWVDGMGLTKLDVPTSIFNDVMAMRECENALKLDPGMGAAVSLWLAANSKREADLPPGGTDPTHAGDPDAHYYNVSSGVQYLNGALMRAIRDQNAPVAYKLTASLQDIIGPSNMSMSGAEPVVQALYFPNEQVRYEAAFALAESLPSQPFPGSDRVVPLLVAALSQTGHLNVLLVAPAGDQLNQLRAALQGTGCSVVGAGDPTDAANAAESLPSIDAVAISEDSDVGRMIDLRQTTEQLQTAPILVLTRSEASPYAVRAATDPMLSVALMPAGSATADALKADLETALGHSGLPAMTDDQAAAYARKAADLLANLALCRGQVLDLAPAEPGVLAALGDSRNDIAMAAGRVLAMMNSTTAQSGLAARALDANTPAPVRVSLFKSLAANAKFFGNRLGPVRISQLEQTVAGEKDADVRGAAAEARGALNLPASQARTLILAQSKS
ncbi:MAG: HEAT repeat domain-containing protein [Tepidisphaeraceae bacterium]